MSWHWKSPTTFPAKFTRSLENAIADPDTPIPFESFGDQANARAAAERYRYFLWCIRSRPDFSGGLSLLVSGYDIRSQIKEDEVGWVLFIRARRTKLGEIERLNPGLLQSLQGYL